MIYLAPIVEGHGEVEAFPNLLHRVLRAEGYNGHLQVNPPIRVKSGSFLNDDVYRQKMLILAFSKAAAHNGSVVILLDCEDQCPATLGPEILTKAKEVRGDIDVFVALSHREYETWFITSAQSLRGRHGLPMDLDPPPAPESIRGAKEWLSERMHTKYDPITHQAEFTRAIDLTEARRNPSFARLCGKLKDRIPPT